MLSKKVLILSIFLMALLSISVVSAEEISTDSFSLDDSSEDIVSSDIEDSSLNTENDLSIPTESNEIDSVVDDYNIESIPNSDIENVNKDFDVISKYKSVLSENYNYGYLESEWDGYDDYWDDDYWDDDVNQISDPKANLKPKIIYYDPSGNYRGETYEYDWDNYFYGYFKVYKGNTLIFSQLMQGISSANPSINQIFSSNRASLGTYDVKVEDMDGKVWASSTITFIKSSVELFDSYFYAYAGKTFVLDDYFIEGYRSDIDEGLSIYKLTGTVKITINGKTYSKYVKNGNFKIKIKVPSKVKKYKCKITYSGSSLFNPFSGTFKIIAEKEPTKIVTKQFKGVAGKKYTLKLVVRNKETGSLIKSGKVKFKFMGKKYKLKVKKGVAKVKIKMPSKAKTYKFKIKYIGTKLTKSSSKKFKVIVKKPKIAKKSNLKSLTLKVSSNRYHGKDLKNGDTISNFYSTYDGQYSPGIHVEAGYFNNGPDNPRHTKLVKAKVWFKNSNGKVITRTVKRKGTYIKINRISGYSPYKVKIYYKNK